MSKDVAYQKCINLDCGAEFDCGQALFKCPKCGEEFVDLSQPDPFKAAYELYRTRHKLLQPEEIRAFRRRYQLTQAELAGILGLGGATLSRYETGKLQDETHDTLLRLAMEPENLHNLAASCDTLPSARKTHLLAAIEQSCDCVSPLERCLGLASARQEPDEFTGYRRFAKDQFVNAILLFAQEGVMKTKLNKLLFYADFLHFRDFAVSITAARYARSPFGPAPEDYSLFFALLSRQLQITVEEVQFRGYEGDSDVTGERYSAEIPSNHEVFSEVELETLLFVRRHFRSYGAGRISDYSHEEEGYVRTAPGDWISYEHASGLRLGRTASPAES